MIRCPSCHTDFNDSAPSEVIVTCPQCQMTVLDGYCDLVRIGGGAMGEVFRARQANMANRAVAVKIPHDSDPRIGQRFEREIAASSLLQHENIVRAIDGGQRAGRHYLVMEFVEGRPLSAVVEAEHPLTPARVARILRGLASGLLHAEQQGIVNRDLKPDNILLTSSDTAKILDYGLALFANIHGQTDRLTRCGALLGTPLYLAPEQARDPHYVTIAADVYSLGCTAFFCLSGRPFGGSSTDETRRMHAEAPRPQLQICRPDVPSELDELIRQMMGIEPTARPGPSEIVRRLDQMLPQLSDSRPRSLPVADPVQFDVPCPKCGVVYHLNHSSAGKTFDCRDPRCRYTFCIEPPSPPPPMPRSRVASTADGVAVVAARRGEQGRGPSRLPPVVPAQAVPVMAEVVARPTSTPIAEVASAVPAHIAEIASSASVMEIPVSAIVPRRGSPGVVGAATAHTLSGQADSTHPAARPAKAPPPRARKPKRWHPAFWAVFIVIFGTIAVLGGLALSRLATPDPAWEEAHRFYTNKQWTTAKEKFEQFTKDFSGDERVEQVAYFVDMCGAGPEVYSQTGDPEKGLSALEGVFREHRDTGTYKAYCSDLYSAAQRLVERFIERGERSSKAAVLARARAAHELLRTVAAGMTDSWVPANTNRLAEAIDAAERKLEERLAREQAIALATRLQSATAGELKPDEINIQLDQMVAKHPALAQDKELLALRDAALRAEAARVVYRPDPPETAAAGSSASVPAQERGTTIIVTGGSTGQPREGGDTAGVVTALARGVLYVFNAQGQLLWARRLGLDTSHLPSPIEPTTTSPAALLAVSSEDNSLLALEAATGVELWRYPVGQDISIPPTIVATRDNPAAPERRRGFLPTANGELHVLELVLGKRLGRFELGQPMSVGPTYDPVRKLLFAPAESRRVFALNMAAVEHPQQPACSSVLFTEHGAGTLLGEPIVVGPYLITLEASELERMKLRAFPLQPTGFAEPKTAPLREETLLGWSWFPPRAAPDRIALITDRGDRAVIGVNLDNDSEALYRVIQERGVEARTGENSRSLAVHTDEHLFWIVADGKLQQLSLDVLHQQIKRLWPTEEIPPQVTGVPTQEAQVDRLRRVFYLNLMAPDGRSFELAAVESERGAPEWRQQLGLSLVGDPIVSSDRILLVDSTGRVIPISIPKSAPVEDVILYRPNRASLLPPGVLGSQIMRLGPPDRTTHLAAPLGDGRQVALTSLHNTTPGAECQVVQLPSPLKGQPAVLGTYLAAPCDDGYVHLVSLQPGERKTLPSYRWSRSMPPGPDTCQLWPVGTSGLVVVDGGRRVRRIQIASVQDAFIWKPLGGPFESRKPLVETPLLAARLIVLADADGVLHSLRLDDPNYVEWTCSLGGRPGGVWLVGDRRVVATIDGRKLACIDLAAKPAPVVHDDERPQMPLAWTSPHFSGRIRALRVLSADALVVADNSRSLTGLSLNDGSTLWSRRLPVRVGPSAAPTPFGADRLLVPLADGTLLIVALPKINNRVTEVLP